MFAVSTRHFHKRGAGLRDGLPVTISQGCLGPGRTNQGRKRGACSKCNQQLALLALVPQIHCKKLPKVGDGGEGRLNRKKLRVLRKQHF